MIGVTTADLISKKLITSTLNFRISAHQAERVLAGAASGAALHDGKNEIDVLGENGKYARFELYFNDRFAFSLGPLTGLMYVFPSVIAIFVLTFYRYSVKDTGHPYLWGLVFGGASGNMIDKFFVKSVTTREWVFSILPLDGHARGVVDFISCVWFDADWARGIPVLSILSWERWPIFNVGDAAIVCGVIGLLIESFFFAPNRVKRKK